MGVIIPFICPEYVDNYFLGPGSDRINGLLHGIAFGNPAGLAKDCWI
jgi:hypothetical protein